MFQADHSAILFIFVKLTFVINIFVLPIFEWPFYTGFTVNTVCEHVFFSFCPLIKTCALDVQKNSHIKLVLLSNHNICSSNKIRGNIFIYAFRLGGQHGALKF